MSLTRCVALAVAVGCGLTAMGASADDDKPRAPDDAVIKAFVAYLGNNGVKLEANERSWWLVTDPKGDGYKVIVALKTFPPGTSVKEMQAALEPISLAFMLNAPSRLAMSHPGLVVSDPMKKAPKLDQIPVAAKLEKLFKEYRPPHDPLYIHLPEAVRAVFEDTFPDYRCVRMAIRQEKGAAVYRGTVFHPASAGSETRRVGEETVTQPILYHLEVSAEVKVIEETPRPIDPKQLPKAILASYEKWNPKGVKGQELWWMTEVRKGEVRVYRVRIIVNAIKAYSASFKEDGSMLTTDPDVVP